MKQGNQTLISAIFCCELITLLQINQCHKREQRRQGLSELGSGEDLGQVEEVEEERGSDDHREENPLSSAGEEILTECMDCFRQWTHLCTEDRENFPDVEPWRPKPQDTEHGGNGTSVPSSQEGQLSEGSEEIEAGKEKPEPRIPSTSAEEADTQSTT